MKRTDISALRIIAMCMVVFTHCIDAYIFNNLKIWDFGINFVPQYKQIQMFIQAIDITAFCFIAGYLYEYMRIEKNKYKDTFSFLLTKVKRLLVPYLFWFIVIWLLFPGRTELQNIIYSTDHLWFLLMLMWCFVFIALSIKCWEKLPLYANILVYFVFNSLNLIFAHFNILTNILCFDVFLVYFPTFFLGLIFAKERLFKLCTKRIPLFILIISIIIAIGLQYIFTSENYLCSYTLSRIMGLIIVILAFAICFRKMEKLSFLNSPFWKSLDTNSMGIYLIHMIIILVLFQNEHIIHFMNSYVCLAPILLFIVTLFSSWGLSICIRKTPLSFILG